MVPTVRAKRRLFATLTPSPEVPTILVVEDCDADVFLLRMALRESGVAAQLFVASDGAEALMFADQIDCAAVPCPDLVVLDLNLPKFSGLRVLERLRASPTCGDKPVAILSTGPLPSEQREAARLGADLVLEKPMNLEGLSEIAAELKALLPAK
jgi:two-component system response regulator